MSNHFLVENVFFLQIIKKEVVVVKPNNEMIESGMILTQAEKKTRSIIESIEIIDSKKGTFLGLIISYEGVDSLQKLTEGDIVSIEKNTNNF